MDIWWWLTRSSSPRVGEGDHACCLADTDGGIPTLEDKRKGDTRVALDGNKGERGSGLDRPAASIMHAGRRPYIKPRGAFSEASSTCGCKEEESGVSVRSTHQSVLAKGNVARQNLFPSNESSESNGVSSRSTCYLGMGDQAMADNGPHMPHLKAYMGQK
ncbi:hypothetical protein MUK42_06060 [Musa troglodytarum]|uniref:Uncharacterized protein n=1 Tax=Musa troglodytarum TaxID=320322 RepID=A0A9E7GL02_9LILI|nr:hypothetical protein MUK42_06060 [Musa troglodytarum]